MEHYLSPPNPKFTQLLETLGSKLGPSSEVSHALAKAIQNPEHAASIYEEYIAIIDDLSRLSEEDLNRVSQSWQRFMASQGQVNSASKRNVVDVLTPLSPGARAMIPQVARDSIDPDSEYFDTAVEDLTTRMHRGSMIKAAGKKPVDGDPESDRAIWGHTQQVKAGEAQLYFVFAHYLERYFTQFLADNGVEFAASGKDYFLNAMTDVIMLDHFGQGKYSRVFDMWSKKGDEGGLGWLKPDRIKAFDPNAGA